MSNIEGKIIFITGGSGYVGRNLIRMLVRNGATVRALARSETSERIVRELGAKPIPGDLMNEQALSSGLNGADYLIHAAADTSHFGHSAQQEQANIGGTAILYRIAREKHVVRALHISTEAVLLNGNPLRNATEDLPMPKKWGGGYSRSKAQAEKIALDSNDDVLSVVVIRPRFVWGRDDTTALPQLLEANESGRLVWIDGGDYLTSTTHIDNLCHGAYLALVSGRAGEVYFISDGAPLPFREFVSQLLKTKGSIPPTKSVPRFLVKPAVYMGEALSRLTGNRIKGPMSMQEYSTVGVEVTLDITKARLQLGYEPIMNREEGLNELRERPAV